MGGKSKDMIPVNGCYSGLKPEMRRLSPLEAFTSIRPMGGGKAAASSCIWPYCVWTGDEGSCPRRMGPVVGKEWSTRIAMFDLTSDGHGRLE